MRILMILIMLPMVVFGQTSNISFPATISRITPYALVPENVSYAGVLQKGEVIEIIGYGRPGYYKANYKGQIIYVDGERIRRDSSFLASEKPMKDRFSAELLASEAKRKAQAAKESAALKATYTKKYGAKYGPTVANRQIQIGMTKAMVIDSWGKPDDINRTVGSWGVHEQWVYSGSYLYFENGKLTSWQD